MTNPTLSYRPEIDGLRAVAVLPVVFFHAGFAGFSGGYVGVDVFFVISGYLITTILLKEAEGDGISLWRFYDRRARRILPALFLVILGSIPMAWLTMFPSQMESFSQSILAVLFFVSNIFFWREDDYFGAAAEEMPLLHTWSLSVEEQFYLFFPPLIMATFWLARRHVLIVLLITTLGSFAICVWAQANPGISDAAVFYLLPARAWELGIGALCAYQLLRRTRVGVDVLAAAGLAMILAAVVLFDKATPSPSAYTLLPVLGATLIILFCTAEGVTYRLLTLKPVIWIGLISYSLYLWHQPLFAFSRIAVYGQPTPLMFAVLILASFLLAWTSWRFVETPIRRAAVMPSRVFYTFLALGFLFLTILSGIEWRFRIKERIVFSSEKYLSIESPLRDADEMKCMSQTPVMVNKSDICLYGAPNSERAIAVFGNSHAGGFAKELGSQIGDSFLIKDYSASSCLPAIRGYDPQPTTPICNSWSEAALGDIFDDERNRVIVMIFRMDAAPDDAFFSIRKIIDRAAQKGIKIIFVHQVPMQVEPIEYFIYRVMDSSLNATGISVEDWEKRYRHVREKLPDEGEYFSKFEVTDAFCNDKYCDVIRDGAVLYKDEDHLSTMGVSLLAPMLAREIIKSVGAP